MIGTLFAVIAGAGSIQGIFMAAALGKRGKEGQKPDFLLAALMLIFSLNIFHAGFFEGVLSIPGIPESFEPFQPFFGPFVYLYVKSLTPGGTVPALRGRDYAIHLLPAVAISAAMPFVFLGVPSGAARAAGIASWAVSIGYILFYVVITTRRVHAFRNRLKREYSAIQAADLGWVQAFMIAFLSMAIVDYALLAWMIHGDPFPYFHKALALAGTVLVYGLGYQGLTRRAEAPLPADTAPKDDGRSAAPGRKYSRSGLDGAGTAALESKIRSYMEGRKPWLESEFSLQDLAEGIGSPRNQVSQVINEAFDRNFYDFVNEYRVAEVKRLMDSPESPKLKMISLAFDSGFASKPTFNAAFKRITGLTPSQYRQKKEVRADRPRRPDGR